MPSVKITVAATVAALAFGASAYPLQEYLEARQPGAGDVIRAGGKVLKDLAHGAATDSVTQAINDRLNPKKPVDPKVAAEIQKASGSGGFSAGAVNAVVNNPHLGKKKRSLYDNYLAQRDFEDWLETRQPTANDFIRAGSKVVKDLTHNHVTNTVTQAINDRVNPQKPMDPKFVAAAQRAGGGFSSGSVNAVVHNPHLPKSDKKRSLYEEYLEQRDFEDWLETRQPGANDVIRAGARVVKDLAHGHATDSVTQAINDRINPPKPVDPKFAAAAQKASGGFSSGAVNAVVNNPHLHKSGGQKRSLYDDSELFVRNPTAGAAASAGGRLAKEVGHAVTVDHAVKKFKSLTGQGKPLDEQHSAAVKKAQGPFNHELVNSVVGSHTGHQKRGLEALIDELVARALELEELD